MLNSKIIAFNDKLARNKDFNSNADMTSAEELIKAAEKRLNDKITQTLRRSNASGTGAPNVPRRGRSRRPGQTNNNGNNTVGSNPPRRRRSKSASAAPPRPNNDNDTNRSRRTNSKPRSDPRSAAAQAPRPRGRPRTPGPARARPPSAAVAGSNMSSRASGTPSPRL